MGFIETNRRTIGRYGRYGLVFLIATLAVVWSGDGRGFIQMSLLVWLCSAAGAAAALNDFANNPPKSAVATFVAIYMAGVVFTTLAVLPGVSISLVLDVSIRSELVAGLIVEGLFVAGAAASFAWARRRFRRLGSEGAPAGQSASLWLPAMISGSGCAAMLGIVLIVSHPERHHIHIMWHPPAVPPVHLAFLALIPTMMFVICHDSLIRRAVRRLSGRDDVAIQDGVVVVLRGAVIMLGVLFTLGVNLLTITYYDSSFQSVQEVLHYPAEFLLSNRYGM